MRIITPTMISSFAFLCLMIAMISAFQHRPPLSARKHKAPSFAALQYSLTTDVIDISESAPRDVLSLGGWAAGYGVQTSDCFQLASNDDDHFAITNRDLPEGSPVLIIPNGLILMSRKAMDELGADAYRAEQAIMGSEASDRLPQFYLFLKVIREYELGEQSPWCHWLNSLPRYFSNGASMTDFCFGCLPPYAAGLALGEKKRLGVFINALDDVPFVSSEGKGNYDLARWAFAVVHTRYMEMPDGDIGISPMADFFNHGGAETDVSLSYDEQGNLYVYSSRDVPASQMLRICYGDPTNPSNLLARYGFLDESSPATFCKILIDDPSPELVDLGYPSRAVFYNDGSISQEVWDIVLYQELGKVSAEQQQAFCQAHATGDGVTQGGYHEQYFARTFEALQKHVNYLVNELEELGLGLEIQVGQGQDAERHPRLPLIMKHNEFVRGTLERVQRNLDNMLS